MNQRICKSCQTWNDAVNSICSSCGKPIDEKIIREEEKKGRMTQRELAERLKQQPDWLHRFFERLQNSGNPFAKGLYHFIHLIWMVYFSILLFIAWLVFVIAG
jgi:hypothetical protein